MDSFMQQKKREKGPNFVYPSFSMMHSPTSISVCEKRTAPISCQTQETACQTPRSFSLTSMFGNFRSIPVSMSQLARFHHELNGV